MGDGRPQVVRAFHSMPSRGRASATMSSVGNRLPFGLTNEALDAAMSEEDPESLAAATRLRARFGPELAATALTQATLRRQARTKFGEAAAEMFFTRVGLEQATRPEVADHHASRFAEAGVRRCWTSLRDRR